MTPAKRLNEWLRRVPRLRMIGKSTLCVGEEHWSIACVSHAAFAVPGRTNHETTKWAEHAWRYMSNEPTHRLLPRHIAEINGLVEAGSDDWAKIHGYRYHVATLQSLLTSIDGEVRMSQITAKVTKVVSENGEAFSSSRECAGTLVLRGADWRAVLAPASPSKDKPLLTLRPSRLPMPRKE